VAIRRANSAQTNITAEISAVEAGIVPRAALTAAEQEIAQLKSDKGTLRKDVKDARDVADKAIRVLQSTKALLDTANERLVENKLEPVEAKGAPTADGTDGTEDAFSETNANNISVDTDEEDHTRGLGGGRAGGTLKGRVSLFDKAIHVITCLLVPVCKQAFGSYLFTSFVVAPVVTFVTRTFYVMRGVIHGRTTPLTRIRPCRAAWMDTGNAQNVMLLKPLGEL
jgi:hypothetical protein